MDVTLLCIRPLIKLVVFLKSYIKLYGPSIDRGQEALEEMMSRLGQRFPYGEAVMKSISHIISLVDPSVDLATGEKISAGQEILGEYDFVIDWKELPTKDQVRSLIRRIDEALLYTGCRYTITTKE